MALLWIDGFDEIPDTDEDAYLGSAGYLSALGCTYTVGRGNTGRCVVLAGAADTLVKFIGTQTHVYVGFGFQYSGSLAEESILKLTDNGTVVFEIKRGVSNEIMVFDGATLRSSSAGQVIRQDTWAYLECRVEFAGASSRVVVRRNNQIVIDATVTITATDCNRLEFNPDTANTSRYDDVYVLDTTGAQNTSFLGDCFVQNAPLIGNASPIQFSPIGTTSNWQNINETGAADDTKYNVASVVDAQDMFNVRDLSLISDEVYGVQVGCRVRKLGAGAVTVASILSDGVVESISPDFSPDTDFETFFNMFNLEPGGDPWTVSNFNDIQIGYKITS